MPTTIYSRLNDREFVYSRNDLRKIAYWTHEKYVKEFEQDPDKIEQDEEGRIFQVFAYPDEWAEIIDEITDWYFKKKRKIGDNHIKREERAKEIKAQREKRIAEGKFERALPDVGTEKYAPRKPKGQAKGKPGTQGKPNPNNSKGKGPFKPKQDSKKKPGASNNNSKPYSKQGTGQGNNTNRPKQQGGSKPYSQNRYGNNQNNNSRNYNSNPNVQTRQDRSTFNSFESDINSEYNYNKGFAAKYKSGPTPRASYYETPSETKFTKKVEIDLGNSTSADGTKKRKRIAKALFVAAPEPNDSKE